jgi:hypothetical protein
MGTRSLLGYQRADGKIYSQYQQFDGYPNVRGVKYYIEVLKGLQALKSEENPTPAMFTRIQHYLNEIQYASGHSVRSHMINTFNYHDGQKKHKDGSDFFDIAIFKNKKKLQVFVDSLISHGYFCTDGVICQNL